MRASWIARADVHSPGRFKRPSTTSRPLTHALLLACLGGVALLGQNASRGGVRDLRNRLPGRFSERPYCAGGNARSLLSSGRPASDRIGRLWPKDPFCSSSVSLALTWTLSAQDAKPVIANASKAMGVDTPEDRAVFGDRVSISRSARRRIPARRGRSSSTRATRGSSTSKRRRRAWIACACREKTRRAAAVSNRSWASNRRTRRSSSTPTRRGRSSSNLDDAARLPARGGRAECHRRERRRSAERNTTW